MKEAQDVLDFWFGKLDAGGYVSSQHRKLWFAGEQVDEDIRRRYGGLVESALAGELQGWEAQTDSLMALITLLDQFPRNLYRATARAFSGDARASALVQRAIAEDRDQQMPAGWRMMFYMPLEHAESLSEQNLCVAKLELMLAQEGEERREAIEDGLRWAREHRDIVAHFGRFPHRNALLQRSATEEEREWLSAGGKRFGQ